MNDALTVAKKYVLGLKKGGFKIEKAFLFGSFAKGTHSEMSDIDVCVVSKSFGKDFIADMVKLRMMTHKIDYRIEPIPFTPDDLVDPYSSLSLEVRKTGINIL